MGRNRTFFGGFVPFLVLNGKNILAIGWASTSITFGKNKAFHSSG
jgi:hypothetical protein